jgi:hypothetical protein
MKNSYTVGFYGLLIVTAILIITYLNSENYMDMDNEISNINKKLSNSFDEHVTLNKKSMMLNSISENEEPIVKKEKELSTKIKENLNDDKSTYQTNFELTADISTTTEYFNTKNQISPLNIIIDTKPRNPEWEQINKFTFFRRNSSFYFSDMSMLRIFYVTSKDYIKYIYTAKLLVFDKLNQSLLSELHFSNNSYRIHEESHLYQLISLTINNISLFNYDVDRIELKLFLIDLNNNISLMTHYPIDVKISKWIDKDKSGSIACSSSYFYYYGKLTNHQDSYYFKQFQWWFELNRRTGHQKIVLYNTSIPNTQEYKNLFNQYENFVEVRDLKYLPNFLENANNSIEQNDYFTSFEKLNVYLYIVFQTLVLNDCYLSNKHLYNYISVIDQDEIVMPRVNNKIRKNADIYNLIKNLDFEHITNKKSLNNELNLESSCSASNYQNRDFDLYLNNLKKDYAINNDVSFHYMMAFYLSFDSVEIIFKNFDDYFTKTNYSIGDKQNVLIKFNDTSFQNYTYHFLFNNQDDVNYVKNMIKIYKLFIRNFFISNKNTLDQYSNQFNRFFYIAGDVTSHACGKTIHNTNLTWQLTTHYVVGSGHYAVNFNEGSDSHFRLEYTFQPQKTINARDLVLDFNYIYCYYRPILKYFTKLDIINDE